MRKVARKVWKLLLFSQLYAPIKTGLIVTMWLAQKIGMGEHKAEPCVFHKIVENDMSLMVGVHVDSYDTNSVWTTDHA